MPAKTEAQRRLFGIAKAIQEGETPTSYSPAAARIAKTVSSEKVSEFAHKRGGRKFGKSDHTAIHNLMKR